MKYKNKYINLKGGNNDKKKINAILLPHAGEFYVKQIMDYIFDNIDTTQFDNIILLSTNHYRNDNLKFSSYEEFEHKQLREHSPLSIKLYLTQFNKPITIYLISYFDKSLVDEIYDFIVKNNTLLLANTDLLHCGNSYNKSCPQNIDEYNREIINEIIKKNDITNHDVCGFEATKIFLYLIKKLNYKFIEYVYNSSDKINNDNKSSVGYVGITYSKKFDLYLYLKANKFLLNLPKIYLETHFIENIYRPIDFRKIINNTNYIKIDEIVGIFVTIYKSENLKGCIGTFELKGDIIDTILIQTYDSAFHDSRFNKITEDELKDLKYKINYLRKPFITQNIFIDFITGKHGITIYFNDNKQGTYLASVMIDHFNMKENEKMYQEKFNEITESLKNKSNSKGQIKKIELYECIEIF